MKAVFNLLWRLPLFILHIISGLLQECCLYFILGKKWHTKPAGQAAIKNWMKRLCHILGLHVHLLGTPSTFYSTMIVANHISWLDIIALASERSIVFMAKSDVKHWPVFGMLVSASGTLFIERGSLSALKYAVSALQEPLGNGATVAIFPEGTTTEGNHVKPFFSGLFSAALDSGSYLQPVAISYHRNGKPDLVAPYTESETFVYHLFKILLQDSTHVTLDFLPKIRSQGYSRIQIAQLCHQKIQQALHQPCSDETPAILPVIKSA